VELHVKEVSEVRVDEVVSENDDMGRGGPIVMAKWLVVIWDVIEICEIGMEE